MAKKMNTQMQNIIEKLLNINDILRQSIEENKSLVAAGMSEMASQVVWNEGQLVANERAINLMRREMESLLT